MSTEINTEQESEVLRLTPLGAAAESVESTEISAGGGNPFIRAEESEAYKKLEREYREYRTKKALSRIDGVMTGEESAADIRAEFKKIAQEARAKAFVLPCLIPAAKRQLPPTVKIETIIDYPYAGGSKKCVLCEIREAFKKRVSSTVCVNLADFAAGNPRPLEKKISVLKRYASRFKVTLAFNAELLGAEKTARLAHIIKVNKLPKVRLLCPDGRKIGVTADAVRIFYDTLGEQCPVEVVGMISTAEDAETLFSAGADRIVTLDYRTLSRQRLFGLSV